MGKVKEEIEQLIETCKRVYEKGGSAAVIDYIEEAIAQGQDMIVLEVVYERCVACDADMPSINHICLVCGQETKVHKQILVDAVIEDLKKGFALGDYTVLDELLNMLSVKKLVQALPEEEWEKYRDINKSYFEVMHQDFNEDAGREEIQIHAGENGNVYLFQDGDKLGFIVDVYGLNDHVNTMTVWEEDLDDSIDEESGDPRNFSMVELKDFKDEWGQTHDEICAELGYDPKDDGSSEMVLGDGYFWIDSDQKWYPKCASGYSEREQAIADYLRVI